MDKNESNTIYAFCYEGNCRIVDDRDEELTGEPHCEGQCDRCDKTWGDDAISD